jgi:hypothetical protein
MEKFLCTGKGDALGTKVPDKRLLCRLNVTIWRLVRLDNF